MNHTRVSSRGFRSRAFELYVAAAVTFFLVAQAATYVWSFYLRRMSFDDQFHPGSDFPGSVVDAAIHNPDSFNVGVHFFGDFWITFLLSQEPSPYLVRGGVAGSVYPPFAQFLYEPLTWLPYPAALCFFFLVSLCLIVVPFWRALDFYSLPLRVGMIISAIVLTYPVLFAFDRGNNVLIAAGLAFWGLEALKRNNTRESAVMLGLSAAIKIYPIFFLLIFVVRRQWRALLQGLGTAAAASVVPLVFYRGGFIENFKVFFENTGAFRDGGGQIALNHSLYGWFLTIRDSGWGVISDFAGTSAANYRLISVVVVIALVVLAVMHKASSLIDIVVICASLNCLFVPITYGYAHVFMLTIALVFLFEDRFDVTTQTVCVLLAFLVTSKGIPVGPPFARVLNYFNAPIIVLMLIITVLKLVRGQRELGTSISALEQTGGVVVGSHGTSKVDS